MIVQPYYLSSSLKIMNPTCVPLLTKTRAPDVISWQASLYSTVHLGGRKSSLITRDTYMMRDGLIGLLGHPTRVFCIIWVHWLHKQLERMMISLCCKTSKKLIFIRDVVLMCHRLEAARRQGGVKEKSSQTMAWIEHCADLMLYNSHSKNGQLN